MNDDLISRKAVLEELESLRVALTGISCGKEYQTTQKEIMNSVIRIIEEQPTAFDKEKVIEKLKRRAGEECKQSKNKFSNKDLHFGMWQGFTDAIEIVWEGGIK